MADFQNICPAILLELLRGGADSALCGDLKVVTSKLDDTAAVEVDASYTLSKSEARDSET